MALIEERFRGISGDQDSRRIMYVVTDADSDQDALNIAELAAPLTYDLMPRQNISVSEQAKYASQITNRNGQDVEEQDPTVADGLYYVEAIYSRRRGVQPVEETGEKPDPVSPDANHDTFAFEQASEMIRIRESGNATDRYTASGAGVPNQNDAIKLNGINVQSDGTVEGVDIPSVVGGFSYDYFPQKGTVTQAYQDLVDGLAYHVNSATFFNKPAGTVLFTGATGRKRNVDDWEFNFRFEYRANATGLTVGEGSNEIIYSKLGHQYAWVYYDEVDDTNVAGETRTILIPRQVNVETIFPTADLNTLFP